MKRSIAALIVLLVAMSMSAFAAKSHESIGRIVSGTHSTTVSSSSTSSARSPSSATEEQRS